MTTVTSSFLDVVNRTLTQITTQGQTSGPAVETPARTPQPTLQCWVCVSSAPNSENADDWEAAGTAQAVWFLAPGFGLKGFWAVNQQMGVLFFSNNFVNQRKKKSLHTFFFFFLKKEMVMPY